MAPEKKPQHQSISIQTMSWMVSVMERLKPGEMWRRGGLSRWIGTPAVLAGGLIFVVYVCPVLWVLSWVAFWVEMAFLAPKGWLKFNLGAGLVVLAFSFFFMGLQGWIAAAVCLWWAQAVFKTIGE